MSDETRQDRVARWQKRIDPYWGRISGGSHHSRPIPKLIEQTGFTIDRMDSLYLPGTPKFAGFNYWGSAGRR